MPDNTKESLRYSKNHGNVNPGRGEPGMITTHVMSSPMNILCVLAAETVLLFTKEALHVVTAGKKGGAPNQLCPILEPSCF